MTPARISHYNESGVAHDLCVPVDTLVPAVRAQTEVRAGTLKRAPRRQAGGLSSYGEQVDRDLASAARRIAGDGRVVFSIGGRARVSAAWRLDDSGRAWLTMSVQAGFVAGALLSALLNLADRVPAHFCSQLRRSRPAHPPRDLVCQRAGLDSTVALRFADRIFSRGRLPGRHENRDHLDQHDRGLGIGLLVGALTIGFGGAALAECIRHGPATGDGALHRGGAARQPAD